jgi:hypothetical protein
MNRSISSRFSRLLRPLAVLCLSLMLFAIPRPALAGQANAKHLAADAKWFLHLDFEAAKHTVVYAEVLDAVRAQFPLDDTLKQLKAGIGVNPLTDITGVTVYNTSFEKDVAAVIIYAKVDQDMLQLAVSNNPDYKQVAYGKHTLHTWTDNNDGKTKVGCFYGDGMILLADKADTLKMALDVLDGTKTAGSALVKTPEKGAFLYGAVDLNAIPQVADKNLSQLLSNAVGMTMCAAEREGKVIATVQLNTKNAELATQLKKMIDGVKAFGELATKAEHPTVSDLLSKVQVSVDGTSVIGTFEHDSKTILQTLQKIDEENKAAARKAAAVPATPTPAPTKGL